MRNGVANLCALAFAAMAVAACAQRSTPAVMERQVPGDDVTLHVRIAGDEDVPAVLVALHGGPGNCSDYMLSLEQLAGSQLAVVTYDQRGTGRSSKPSEGYSMAKYIADLEAVRQTLGTESVHLLGHSWGGVLALRYAVAYPQRVRSVILAGSGVVTPEAAQQAQAHKAQRVAALQEQGVLPPDLQSLSDILPAYFSDPGFAMPEELQGMYYDPVVEQETWTALEGYDFADGLGDLQLPVLLLWGEDDPFGTAYLESTKRALTGVDLETIVIENCGHYWHECPEPFFEHVRAFLKTAAAQ